MPIAPETLAQDTGWMLAALLGVRLLFPLARAHFHKRSKQDLPVGQTQEKAEETIAPRPEERDARLIILSRVQRMQREEAAREALQERLARTPIPWIEDARITCALCWEERHPGLSWPFPSFTDRCSLHPSGPVQTETESEPIDKKSTDGKEVVPTTHPAPV